MSSRPQNENPLPATVKALGWTSFFTDLSSEAIYPLLPAFLLRELGGSSMSVGLIDGIANAVAAVVRLPAGQISDTIGRRPLVLFGYGLSAVIRPLMGLVSSPFGALVVRAADLGVPAALVPLVWLVMSLAKSGTATAAGRLADGWHPRAALALGWLVFAAAYAGLAATAQLWAVLPLVVLVAIAHGLAEPAERALVSLLAPQGRQGSAFGWYTLVQGLMALPAGLLAGWLWQQGPHGPQMAFAAAAVLATAACLLLAAFVRGPAAEGGPNTAG
jgi:MFS family permease